MTIISKPMLVNPKIQIPQWDSLDDPTAAIPSFYLTNNPCVFNIDSPTTIHGYLTAATDFEDDVDTFSSSSDHFRMFEFKVRTCTRGRSHDWTKCPYAHPGEKARRRDPRKFKYSGTECPESRNGNGSCRKGDSCGFSHGVFESWLHPDRYRTQPCRDGISCRRRVCFFAHTSEQLRIPLSNSPPMSPNSPRIGDELVSLMNNLQLRARRVSSLGSAINSESCGFGVFGGEEEPAMERVESGRDLRARMYAKLMRENSLERVRSYQPMISDGFWS